MKRVILFLVIAGILAPNMITLHTWSEFKLDTHTKLECLALSQDGKKLASASSDGTMKLWDIEKLRKGEDSLLGEFEGHRIPPGGKFTVYSLSFSPEGDFLASGSEDKTVKIWQVPTRKELGVLRSLGVLGSHEGAIRSISFSARGKSFASGSDDGTVKIWDVSDVSKLPQTPKYTLSGHTSPVLSVCFSQDGELLASGSNDGKVRIWRVSTGEEIASVSAHDGAANSVSFGPNKLLASGGDDRKVKIWDASTISQRTMRNPNTLTSQVQVKSVSFNQNKKELAFESSLSHISLWDLSREPREVIKEVEGSGRMVKFSHDGNILALFSTENITIIFYNMENQ